MERSYYRVRLKAKFGVPGCEMGPIASEVEFDFVISLQHLARFCIARDLDHVDEFLACSVAEI
jgi:hypothetical protein